jgi:hypothetical protein
MHFHCHLALSDKSQRMLLESTQQIALILGRPAPQSRALESESLVQDLSDVGVRLELRSGEESEEDHRPVPAEQVEVGGEIGSTDKVDDQVDAGIDLLDLLLKACDVSGACKWPPVRLLSAVAALDALNVSRHA